MLPIILTVKTAQPYDSVGESCLLPLSVSPSLWSHYLQQLSSINILSVVYHQALRHKSFEDSSLLNRRRIATGTCPVSLGKCMCSASLCEPKARATLHRQATTHRISCRVKNTNRRARRMTKDAASRSKEGRRICYYGSLPSHRDNAAATQPLTHPNSVRKLFLSPCCSNSCGGRIGSAAK